MAKIHVDCDEAIYACEKYLQDISLKYNEFIDRVNKYGIDSVACYLEANIYNQNGIKMATNLMHGAAYLKYKNRRLILDTQSDEFNLISKLLLEEES